MIVAVCPKCGADLEALIYTTYPPIHAYRCRKCGWTQEERENITRVPIATVERKPITNADRIRSMTDEELAGFCAHTLPFAPWCDYDKENGWCELESCEPCALSWLKEEANE